jgi:decaprenylphospho-beta-D-erythro-pentofuranosid-2-ulose 2-reductase
MRNKGVLILGATSAIARSAAHAFAEQEFPLYLAGRDIPELERIAADIRVRFSIEAKHGYFDAEAYRDHFSFLERVVQEMQGLQGILLAFGDLGEEKTAFHDFPAAHKIIDRNFTGACSILTHGANYFEDMGEGFILAISSVAGDRGRQSNYIYGASKGGLSLFLQGLRNRLFPLGVRVITIKPGFVDTAMTFGKPGLFLVASPQYVGKKIVDTLKRSRDIVYIPWFWRYIMLIIKMVPEFIFKRLKL